MDVFFQEIFTILTSPPGSLTYHLVVTFSVVGALLAAINHWRASQYPQDKRLVIGLSVLLGLRVVLFAFAAIAWQGLINDLVFLPIFDRAVSLLSLILIIWLWAFPEPSKPADSATLLLSILVLIITALGIVWWSGQGDTTLYNGSIADTIGEIVALSLMLLGGLILLLRKPNGWEFGLAMLGLLFLGNLAYLILPKSQSNYSGILRLAEMAAYPLLLMLPQRFPLTSSIKPTRGQVSKPERPHYAADPQLLEDLLALGSETKPEKVCQAISSAISRAMLADICLLTLPPDENGEMIFQCGYDLIREESLEGFTLNSSLAPEIADALRAGLPLSLPASSTSPDLKNLGGSLNLDSTGHLLQAPIRTLDAQPLFGIIVLSPLSNRVWTKEDQVVLINLAERLAYLLQHSEVLYALQTDLDQTQSVLQATQEEIDSVRHENESLLTQLQDSLEVGDIDRSQAGSLAALIVAHEEAQELIARLQSENEQLQVVIPGQVQEQGGISDLDRARIQTTLPGEGEHLEGELRLALEEVAYLKAELSKVDEKVLALNSTMDIVAIPEESAEEVASIAEELRRPLSSIIGYTAFLLGESAGILGNLQHKYLERIKISSERMQALIDELGDVTAPETGRRLLMSETIDLNVIIDEAIDQTQDQLRQKNIVLRVDLPDDLPQLFTDQDSLGQALTNLLENAGEVTPTEGEISLCAQVQSGDFDKEYMLLQITDQGGGIPLEFMPRVFSRISFAGSDPIPGIGEKRASLSIVKMLIENLGGRIWVDSEPDISATYSILLPVSVDQPSDNGAGGLPG